MKPLEITETTGASWFKIKNGCSDISTYRATFTRVGSVGDSIVYPAHDVSQTGEVGFLWDEVLAKMPRGRYELKITCSDECVLCLPAIIGKKCALVSVRNQEFKTSKCED